MIETVGEIAKRESFSAGKRFLSRCTVRENTRQVGNFSDPPAIIFAL